MSVGPLQLVFVGFTGDVLESSVIDELYFATSERSVRLLDLLVVEKDDEGVVWSAELSDLTPEGEEEIRYGALLGEIVGLEQEDSEASEEVVSEDSESSNGVRPVAGLQSILGLDVEDVNTLVNSLPIGHSGLLALIEHVWAGHLHQATLDAGGVLLGQALIEPEGLILFGAHVQAAVDAVEKLEATE